MDPRSSLVVQLLVQIPNLSAAHHSSSRHSYRLPHVISSPHMASSLNSDITFDMAKDVVKQDHEFLIFEMCIQPLYMAQASGWGCGIGQMATPESVGHNPVSHKPVGNEFWSLYQDADYLQSPARSPTLLMFPVLTLCTNVLLNYQLRFPDAPCAIRTLTSVQFPISHAIIYLRAEGRQVQDL
jgi:hypothetical protein